MTCTHEGSWHSLSRIIDGEVVTICNFCGLEGAGPSVPDVYLGRTGQTFGNLCDEMGRPYEIQSKRHKKEIMDRLGVREAGDRVNGATFGTKTWIEGTREHRRKQFEKDRPMIRENYKRFLDNVRKKNAS
jgi:hypothetical protein